MRASDVVALSSIVIAVLALAVSVYQSMLTRQHNRRSVRPALQLRMRFRAGETAGLLLINAGIGPAVITGSTVSFGKQVLGPWDEPTSNVLRGDAKPRPSATTFTPGTILATDYAEFLLSVDEYDPNIDWHAALVDLLRNQVTFEITYESLYGGKDTWTVTWPTSRS